MTRLSRLALVVAVVTVVPGLHAQTAAPKPPTATAAATGPWSPAASAPITATRPQRDVTRSVP